LQRGRFEKALRLFLTFKQSFDFAAHLLIGANRS
jgi:hypothetical protein